jgi:heme o synthase
MAVLSMSTTSPSDIVALTKPKITIMAVVVAAVGMLVPSKGVLSGDAILSLFGIAFLVSGSSALNMYWERETDGLMLRTRNRPLPAKRLHPYWALYLGFALSSAAVLLLLVCSNVLTAVLGFLSLVAYVLLYTPMKRISSLSLVVGAVPGAMPVLLGYTAVNNQVNIAGLALFGLAFFWQLPHFIAISIFRKEEYCRAGYPVVAYVTGDENAKYLIVASTTLLIASAYYVFHIGLGGKVYLVGSSFLGLWFLAESLMGLRKCDLKVWSKRVFWASLVYQFLLFLLLGFEIFLKSITAF